MCASASQGGVVGTGATGYAWLTCVSGTGAGSRCSYFLLVTKVWRACFLVEEMMVVPSSEVWNHIECGLEHRALEYSGNFLVSFE